MNVVVRRPLLAACLLLLSLPSGPGTAGASPVGTAFTYQGTLLDDGAIPTAQYDFEVELYDDPLSGLSAGGPLLFENVQVSEGLFQLELDFGAAFAGEQRWLELRVRDAASSGSFETLLPRQELTAAPQALFALTGRWSGLTGIPEGFDDEVDDDALVELDCADGEVAVADGEGFDCATFSGGGGGTGWSLTGNAGTVVGTHFLGTTDFQPLEVRVNGTRALKIEATNLSSTQFNLVAGRATVASGLVGITIAGGGSFGAENAANANWGSIGGGYSNVVGTAGEETLTAGATVGGGWFNLAQGGSSTVGGGASNFALGHSSTVAGGNTNRADGLFATVGGGNANEAWGDYSVIAGGGPPPSSSDGNRAHDAYCTVGGGGLNTAGIANADPSAEAYATVAGGRSNRASYFASTVAGGESNRAAGPHAFAGGGEGNEVLAAHGVIAGGEGHLVAAAHGAIGGGGPFSDLTVTLSGNRVFDAHGTVGGGSGNIVGNGFTGTGEEEIFATIAGGADNWAWAAAFVGGGFHNSALGNYSGVAGGQENLTNGPYDSIGGGYGNYTFGYGATIPGGIQNHSSGNSSLAAGHAANAAHNGAFVWSDTASVNLTTSPGPDTFSVNAGGGIWLGTDNSPTIPSGSFIHTSTGAYLSSVGVWESVSDRERKERFESVDAKELLDKIETLPITTWSYIGDPTGARHLGPTAQDFHALFGVGSSDRTISPIDASGIALAAIQELAKRTAELGKALSLVGELEKRIAALEAARGAR